jgi:hypothetical protein
MIRHRPSLLRGERSYTYLTVHGPFSRYEPLKLFDRRRTVESLDDADTDARIASAATRAEVSEPARVFTGPKQEHSPLSLQHGEDVGSQPFQPAR